MLAIVCPVADDSEWAGIVIFDAPPGETARIMDGDPAVTAGVLAYEVHPVRGFPGDRLPPGRPSEGSPIFGHRGVTQQGDPNSGPGDCLLPW